MLAKEIIKIINEENIHLMLEDLDEDVLGTFLSVDGLDIIIINATITENFRLYNTVVAEEIGHYFTSKGNSIPCDISSSQANLNYEKNENIALRWALDCFLPTEKLINVIFKNNQINLKELSKQFGFTEEFIMQKFYLLSLKQNKIKLNNYKFLILSSYPTIYIYDDYERSIEYGHSTKAR